MNLQRSARSVVAACLTAATAGWAQQPVTIDAKTYQSWRVLDADTIDVLGVGRVRLLGVHAPEPGQPGYEKALRAMRKYTWNKIVKVRLCASTSPGLGERPGIVYFQEDGKWYDLNQKMLRAGLASAVAETGCDVDTSGWTQLVEAARAARRGLYHMDIDLAVSYKPPVKAATPAPSEPRETHVPRAPTVGTVPVVSQSAAPATASRSAVTVKYAGNARTRTFHRIGCGVYEPDRNSVFFSTRMTALRSNYRPCRVCMP